MKKFSLLTVVLGIVSTVGMFILVGLIPINTPETWWFLFLSGSLAICTMILPGISGSFVLLLIGKYQYIIGAVSNWDFGILIFVALGCIVGILLFVRFLSWLFFRFHDGTLAILTGLVLGSLRKIWPWKETLSTITSRKGEVMPVEQINIVPLHINSEVMLALAFCCVGFVLALLMSQYDSKASTNYA